MERANRTFEEQWHQALNEAEVSPPPHVWVGIENALSNDRVAAYKKQADFYKRVAAACLLLFAVGSALFWFTGLNTQSQTIAEENGNDAVNPTHDQTANELVVVLPEDEQSELPVTANSILSNAPEAAKTPEYGATENKAAISNAFVEENTNSTPANHLAALSPIDPKMGSTVEPWATDNLYAVPRTWEEVSDEFAASPLWAGVSFSSGAFDPGFDRGGGHALSLQSMDNYLAESTVPQNVARGSASFSPGQSVGGGLSVGKRVTKRVTVSSGVIYNAFSTGSVSSQLVTDNQENTYALTNQTNDEQLESALNQGALTFDGRDVRLANQYQYLSIPLKAGYVLLDKKFNITLNTGLSGNFRVNSKLVADGESDDLSNDFSTSDSYQSVYFNFLTSVEFGYLFKDHYQFLLEPNYNQALTDFTSSSNSNQGRPVNIGITIGFRYNF